MEPDNTKKVIFLLESTIALLSENNQQDWSGFLKICLENFVKSDDKREAVLPIINAMLGGSGSLSDVVLHRNGSPLVDENNRLYNLLNELYDECKKI